MGELLKAQYEWSMDALYNALWTTQTITFVSNKMPIGEINVLIQKLIKIKKYL